VIAMSNFLVIFTDIYMSTKVSRNEQPFQITPYFS